MGWTTVGLLAAGIGIGMLLGWWLSVPSGKEKLQEEHQLIVDLLDMVLESMKAHQAATDQVERKLVELPKDQVAEALRAAMEDLKSVDRQFKKSVDTAVQRCREKVSERSGKLASARVVGGPGADDEAEEQSETATGVETGELEDAPFASGSNQSASDLSVPGSDRRREQRFPYDQIEKMAFYEIGHLPSLESFCDVRCIDISTVGISFLMDERPPSKNLVITLSHLSEVKYMKARVVHVGEANGNGAPHQIGCEFIERLDRRVFFPEV